ncbi:cytochrome c oxidase assembly protein [Salinibacterium sp. SYSU T00001]|uniref:cytochrome c oxidase assembly protein n=1 Tax=Homoserinimonas sedimenticola TaxID=2986805 RepID=UPI0022362187|nr:cytochrome c oxidase assembly protein [Salinibacterium sedimenticola]MCW4386176.1 cytochrome c oxidase assembly protein [Salinibacterium sedimenticola]
MHHHGEIALSGESLLLIPFVFAAAMYLAGVVLQMRRGRPWPQERTALWMLGLVVAASGALGQLGHSSFAGHMAAHLAVGMVAPLLLVLGAPVTLALRSLHIVPARRLSRLLRSIPARMLMNPVVAATLNVGGMWVFYLTPLYSLAQGAWLFHVLVMVHLLIVGFLFTAAIVTPDPSPHRSSFALRAVVLLLALAAHAVLAKYLYANPPAGVALAEAQEGAQLMFYGGDLVDLVLLALLGAQWYRVSGRRLARASVALERRAA